MLLTLQWLKHCCCHSNVEYHKHRSQCCHKGLHLLPEGPTVAKNDEEAVNHDHQSNSNEDDTNLQREALERSLRAHTIEPEHVNVKSEDTKCTHEGLQWLLPMHRKHANHAKLLTHRHKLPKGHGNEQQCMTLANSFMAIYDIVHSHQTEDANEEARQERTSVRTLTLHTAAAVRWSHAILAFCTCYACSPWSTRQSWKATCTAKAIAVALKD
mmetsp:Transcript_30428/g.70972  ORF Transcript_30428/g.70972 Transcript_30428/m.70972 type:complete len:213 (-) Transcript_30428:1001-1639(-)